MPIQERSRLVFVPSMGNTLASVHSSHFCLNRRQASWYSCQAWGPHWPGVLITAVCLNRRAAGWCLCRAWATRAPRAVLPRPPLPESLTGELRERLPNAVFASNPCRIRHYTQVTPPMP